ncbi:hypothetical protein [Shinella sp.]|uniref:hypothetical protein n=1 Tax=Shinella sp. TaxID=1870904 RepID=UPI0029A0F153|nr:hypothetical protein [Shinella sp.]MDX3978516.1 hypothetical protein [Shinella sp.]
MMSEAATVRQLATLADGNRKNYDHENGPREAKYDANFSLRQINARRRGEFMQSAMNERRRNGERCMWEGQ